VFGELQPDRTKHKQNRKGSREKKKKKGRRPRLGTPKEGERGAFSLSSQGRLQAHPWPPGVLRL
jgi:hypothetical protein